MTLHIALVLYVPFADTLFERITVSAVFVYDEYFRITFSLFIFYI